MARIKELTFQQVKSIGSFETKRINAVVEVERWEDPDEVYADLERWVCDSLNGKTPKTDRFKPYEFPPET